MSNFTFSLRASFLGLLLTGFAALPSVAQTQMSAFKYEPQPYTFNTTNPEQAYDASISTAASLEPQVVGGAALRVDFPTPIQPGQQAILYVKAASGLLDASVLGRMAVRTYSSKSPDQSLESMSLSDKSISVSALSGDGASNKIVFTAQKALDQLELRVSALANVSSNVAVYAVFGTVAPLPVQLATFQGKPCQTGVKLSWETASERNTDYFEVQRAESLASGYSSLGQVKSAGSSTQARTYQFVDTHAAGLQYYRLRLVDLDGTESFSPVATVDAGLLAKLAAYPTLATTTINITGPVGMHLGLFDQQGQQVQVADIASAQPQQLDVSRLPGGVYFLRDAATGHSTRFIKSTAR